METLINKIVDAFHQQNCRLADHGLQHLPFERANPTQLDKIITKRREGDALTQLEISQYKTYMLFHFSNSYNENDWVIYRSFGDLSTDIHWKIYCIAHHSCI